MRMSRVEGRDQARSASEGQQEKAALPMTDRLSCVSNTFGPQSRILSAAAGDCMHGTRNLYYHLFKASFPYTILAQTDVTYTTL